MAQLVERNLGNKPLELGDTLAIVNATKSPLLAKLRTHGQLDGMEYTSPFKKYRKGSRAPRTEGAAISTFNSNTGQGIKHVAQIFNDGVSVSQVANAVRTATEDKGEQIDAQLEESATVIQRMMESAFFSDQESNVEDGSSNRWATRGLFKHAQATAQSHYATPADARPLAGQKYASAIASFTEDSWKAIGDSLFASVDGEVAELDGYVGIEVQRRFDLFTSVTGIASGETGTARYARPDASKYISKVTQVEISGLKVNLLPTNRLLTDTDGEATASTPKAGIFIDPQHWSVGYVKDVVAEELGKDGSGERWLTECIAMLITTNPRGTCQIVGT